MNRDALALHDALVSVWARLCDAIDGARFERRSDLIVAVFPRLPIPQCNGPWVVTDTQAAVDAMPAAIAEVEAAGELPWVQTRSGHHRTQAAARELGLTQVERVPAMIVYPGELAPPNPTLGIGPIAESEIHETNVLLAAALEAPEAVFAGIAAALATIPEATWYVGRLNGRIVSTALGVTVEGATGIFNVATPTEHRGRGYGSALTARAAHDGFEAGSRFAFLQSSDMGHAVYGRLGFRDVEEYILFTRPLSE